MQTETTRRTLLKTAGVAAAGSMLFQSTAAAQGTGAPGPAPGTPATDSGTLRSQAWCMLRTPQGDSLGVRRENRILDVGKAGKALKVAVPASTDDLVEGKALAGLKKVLAAPASSVKAALVPVEEARFGPCITRPQKIMMLGFNYRRHAQETGSPIPKAPVLFNKYNNALAGHEGVIHLPTKVRAEVRLRGRAAGHHGQDRSRRGGGGRAPARVRLRHRERLLGPRPPVPGR